MALDIKPTRSELINLKRRIKQTKNGYKLLKMKRDGLFHEFRTLLSDMIEAKKDKLIHNDKIEVRKSILQGYGVFAKDFIKKGEILEECHLVEVPKIPYPNNKEVK